MQSYLTREEFEKQPLGLELGTVVDLDYLLAQSSAEVDLITHTSFFEKIYTDYNSQAGWYENGYFITLRKSPVSFIEKVVFNKKLIDKENKAENSTL